MPNLKKIKASIYKKNINLSKRKKILIATSAGGLRAQLVLESMIGLGLEYSGSEVEFLLCDEILPACIIATYFNSKENDIIRGKEKSICDTCFSVAFKYLNNANIKVNKFSDYISKDQIKSISENFYENLSISQIKDLKIDNIKVGEHAYAGALRFFAKTNMDDEKNAKEILLKYLKSSIISKIVTENILKKKKYDHILLNHGIYVPHGVIVDIARKNNISTSTWCPGYRKNSFCITNGDTYHRSLIYEDNSNWENIKLNADLDQKITNYLESRKSGINDWIHFYKKKPNFNVKEYFEKIGIDKNKPLIGLATSVLWDAQIDFPSNFYKDQLEWIFDTINFFNKNQNIQLVIRVSPAEINYGKPSRQKVFNEVMKKFKTLSPNIFIIKPEETISSYAVLERCKYIIIYGSRIGIELAAQGKNIIVCGEGFIRNKKIAIDINSREHYLDCLNNISQNKLDNYKTDILRAKKYAYHFFFRRMLQFKSIQESQNNWPNFTISENFQKHLVNKTDPALENTMSSIINDNDFILNDEKIIR